MDVRVVPILAPRKVSCDYMASRLRAFNWNIAYQGWWPGSVEKLRQTDKQADTTCIS